MDPRHYVSAAPENLLTTMELAYSAFNCPDWIEFILRVPTPISDEAVPGRLTYLLQWCQSRTAQPTESAGLRFGKECA